MGPPQQPAPNGDLPSSPGNAAEQEQQAWYKKGSLPLGSCICGIPIYLHCTFFILLAIMIITSFLSHPSDPAVIGLIALVYGPILLVTIIIVRGALLGESLVHSYVPGFFLCARKLKISLFLLLFFSLTSMNLDMP
jgi:hypothetical protein